MKKSFIEVYDGVLPSDICDYIKSLFDRESMMEEENQVYETQTYSGINKGLVSAIHLHDEFTKKNNIKHK